jgi:hypothetical protein
LAASNSNTNTMSSQFWSNFKSDRSDGFLGNRHLGPNGEYDSYGDMNAGYDQDYNMSNNYNATGYTPAESTNYGGRGIMTDRTINDVNGPPAYRQIDQFKSPNVLQSASRSTVRSRFDSTRTGLDQTPYRKDSRTTASAKNFDTVPNDSHALKNQMYQLERMSLLNNFGNKEINDSGYDHSAEDVVFMAPEDYTKYSTPYKASDGQYQYGDLLDRPDGDDFKTSDGYKKERRYINGALVTDVTKDGSMNYNAPQAYTDATGVGLRVIETDRVRRDIGDSSNISLGFGTDFGTARPGTHATENLGKTFY